MSSTFGSLFRVTTFGESHGRGVGAIVDGCPPRIPLSEADIQPQLDRRRPGQSALTTERSEADQVDDPFGRRRRADHGNAHRPVRGQQRPAARGLPEDAGDTAAFPRRFHLPGQNTESGPPAAAGAPVRGRPSGAWRPGPSLKRCCGKPAASKSSPG